MKGVVITSTSGRRQRELTFVTAHTKLFVHILPFFLLRFTYVVGAGIAQLV